MTDAQAIAILFKSEITPQSLVQVEFELNNLLIFGPGYLGKHPNHLAWECGKRIVDYPSNKRKVKCIALSKLRCH